MNFMTRIKQLTLHNFNRQKVWFNRVQCFFTNRLFSLVILFSKLWALNWTCVNTGPVERDVGLFLWKGACYIVKDLYHIQTHLMEKRKHRKADKAIAHTIVEAPKPPPFQVLHGVPVYIVHSLAACHSDEGFSSSSQFASEVSCCRDQR